MHFYEGTPDMLTALIQPNQNPNNFLYIKNQLNKYTDNISDFGKEFLDGAKILYDKFVNSDTSKMARQIIKNAKNIFEKEKIIPLTSLKDLQNAYPVMQRYIMACPEVYERYNQQRCAGYPDTYINPIFLDSNVKIPPVDQLYEYRRVMDGMAYVDENTNEWGINHYPDDLKENDKELLLDEKSDILITWDALKFYLQSGGKDPTDPYNGTL